jgi:hypothetical protein
VNFAEHLDNHRNADGSYDLDAAEEDRRFEMETSSQEIARLTVKAAKQERNSWMNQETAMLRKQFAQPALSPMLEPDVMVPLGNGTVVRLGDMNHSRIAMRRSMRSRAHDDERRAFAAEVAFWERIEQLLQSGETVEGAILRSQSVPA